MTPTTAAERGRVYEGLAGTYQFTVEEYHRLINAAILTTNDKVELLDGYVLYKPDHVDPPPVVWPHPEWRWLRRWSVAEYHRMIGLGILTPDDKLELLDGFLVLKMPQNTPHGSAVERLTEDLFRVLPAGWRVRIQLPITLADSEPEPDAALVRGDRRTYSIRHPGPGDFGVVFEVADSSRLKDRRDKGEMYAEAGLPVYWIVNVADGQVEVYADPAPAADPPAYRTRVDYRPGQDVPVVLDGRTVGTISVAELIA